MANGMNLSEDAIDVLYQIRNRGGRIPYDYLKKRQKKWQKNLDDVMKELKSLVIVRRTGMVEFYDDDFVEKLLRSIGKLPGHHSEYHHHYKNQFSQS